MKLWLISQDVNGGYDTYSDAVVAADTEAEARLIHPSGYYKWQDRAWTATRADGTSYTEGIYTEGSYSSWASPDLVKAVLIGTAAKTIKQGLICASFHAG